MGLLQENKNMRAPQVTYKSAVATNRLQVQQTFFCRRCSIWRATATPQQQRHEPNIKTAQTLYQNNAYLRWKIQITKVFEVLFQLISKFSISSQNKTNYTVFTLS